MSQIIKNESDIIKISEQLENLRRKGYTEDVLEEILETIIPKNNKYQVEYKIDNFGQPAFFNPNDKSVCITPEILKEYITKLISPILEMVPNIKQDELFNIYTIFVLLHEVEHINQRLIGEKYVEFPYQFVVEAYKNIISLKISKDINPIYAKLMIKNYFNHMDKHTSLLERNANIEAYDILSKVAEYENNLRVKKYLENQKRFYLTCGYKGIFNGAVSDIYHKTLMNEVYKKIPKNEDIPLEDRVRYGLPIDIKTRAKVLKRNFEI